ncbi:MAG: hypothetical protein WC880_05205 [Candidatus Paceibacterota bacterium]
MNDMNKSYYKKVDRSMMDWGLTVPKDFTKDFEAGSPVKLGGLWGGLWGHFSMLDKHE